MKLIHANFPTLDKIEQRLGSIEAQIAEMYVKKSPVYITGWVTSKAAAQVLGISTRTLQSYRDQGIIPFTQFGREIRYRSEDLQSFLMQHYNQPRFWKQEGGAL